MPSRLCRCHGMGLAWAPCVPWEAALTELPRERGRHAVSSQLLCKYCMGPCVLALPLGLLATAEASGVRRKLLVGLPKKWRAACSTGMFSH